MREIKEIIVHHSAEQGKTPQESMDIINNTHRQKLHPKPNGYGYHVAYHYVIFSDGSYKKTRPIKEIGYHAGHRPTNKVAVGICLSGNFEKTKPTKKQLETMNEIIWELQSGYDNKLLIRLHREVKATLCPGKNFKKEFIEKEKTKKPLKGRMYDLLLKVCGIFRGRVDNPRVKDHLHQIAEIIRWNK